jgi:hypothetical protein
MCAFTALGGDDTTGEVNRSGRLFVSTCVAVVDLITVGRDRKGEA